MNELIVHNSNLPDTMEDLARFVLFGHEKYNSVRAEIRAIEKLKLAEEVRNLKRQEAQMIAETVLDAEVRLGELFEQIPRATKGNQYTGKMVSNTDVTNQKSKEETLKGLGFSKMQSSRLENLADNKDLVEFVKAEARENNEFPTKIRVLELAAYQKKQRNENDEYDAFINLRMSVYKELSKIIDLVDKFEINQDRMDALRDNFDEILRIDDHIRYINETIEKLNIIKTEIWKGARNGKKL